MKYLTRQGLMARGWRYGDIDNLLPSPQHSAGVPVWLKKDVLKVERSAQWQKSRSATSKLVKKLDITPYKNYINGLKINIPEFSIGELEKETLQVQDSIYELNMVQIGAGQSRANPKTAKTMHRWEINYLRHVHTDLDYLKEKWKGKPGMSIKITLYKIRVLEEIKKVYPHLQDECDYQLAQLNKIKLV